jgi:hypothetical protein
MVRIHFLMECELRIGVKICETDPKSFALFAVNGPSPTSPDVRFSAAIGWKAGIKICDLPLLYPSNIP